MRVNLPTELGYHYESHDGKIKNENKKVWGENKKKKKGFNNIYAQILIIWYHSVTKAMWAS